MSGRTEIDRAKVLDGQTKAFLGHRILFKNNEDGNTYVGLYKGPVDLPSTFSLDQIELENVAAVPIDAFYPSPRDHWTVAPAAVFQESSTFVKEPYTLGYEDDDPPEIWPSAELTDEIEVMEILKTQPHPGLAEYKGVKMSEGLVLGIALKKYNFDLQAFVRRFDEGVPKGKAEAILAQLRSALTHLHDLGYVHHDVCPANIMFDANEDPVLIDFDSCFKIGSLCIGKGGHTGWERPSSDPTGKKYLSPEDDWYSLDLLAKYLSDPNSV